MNETSGNWKEQGAERHTEAQRKMLNAICGDLAAQIRWHGYKLDKDDFRHLLCGVVLGWRSVPSYDRGDGRTGIVMLGGSSLKLSKTQASEAITIGLHIGDAPHEQGLQCKPVQWSDTVLLGLGHNPNDLRAA